MMPESSLFEGKRVRLSPISLELDASIIANWTYDLEFARFFRDDPPRPLAIFEIKKQIEDWQKKSEERRNSFYFSIKLKNDVATLIGILRIPYVEWNNQFAILYIYIAEKKDEIEYFQETANLVLSFLYNELNIHSVGVLSITSDQVETINAYLKVGFSIDVRMRETQYRKGKYLDEFCLGLLRQNWEKQDFK